MLTENEFLVLDDVRVNPGIVQREIAEHTGLSLGTVNGAFKQLEERKYCKANFVTELGMKALEPYKVENAIIMAAGLSSRFAPISYEKPKGTLTVRGEILIERVIRQLQAAGINNIIVVIGYMKEQYLYLEDTFGVKLVINEIFAERNNNSTLKLVEDQLSNTYIVTSDNYFVENVFKPYVYHAYYASVYMEGPTEEWCLRTEKKKRITKVTIGGADEWVMYGEAYWDRTFSQHFVKVLNDVYDNPETKPKLWEAIYVDHLREFDMHIKKYPEGVIYEFDSLDDVREFDPNFITNINSGVLDNICTTLSCKREDIRNIAPMEAGLSNFSFYFKVIDKEYVYRHPGLATQGILNRAVEAEVEEIAYGLGLDESFLYQDPIKGWKISHFITVTEPFDYHNKHHVKEALAMVKKLHRSDIKVDSTFDLYQDTQRIKALLIGSKQLDFPDFEILDTRATRLYEKVHQTTDKFYLCHNDFYEPNILVADNRFYLIDWEYAGMSDYASDLGTFICCSDYTFDEAVEVLTAYFEREPTSEELFHCMAYVSLAGYFWFIWALNKEAANESVGEWLHRWYRYAKEFGEIADNLSEQLKAQ